MPGDWIGYAISVLASYGYERAGRAGTNYDARIGKAESRSGTPMT